MKFLVLAALSLLVSTAARQSLTAAPEQNPLRMFEYDAKAPLDLKEEAPLESVEGIAVHDVSFAVGASRANAYIAVPPGKGPFPAIVYMHWGQGNRTEFLPEAIAMAKAGASSLLLEPAQPENGEMAGYAKMVRDIRRAVDVLSSRPNVDPKRIVYVGHSLGATWGGVLAASEPRFSGFVLMAGLPALSDFMQNSQRPEDVRMRARMPKDAFKKMVDSFAPYDSVKWIAKAAPRAIFFQWADHDQYISRADAEKYFATAAQPKSQKTYFSGHELNGWDCFNERKQWLLEQLGREKTSR